MTRQATEAIDPPMRVGGGFLARAGAWALRSSALLGLFTLAAAQVPAPVNSDERLAGIASAKDAPTFAVGERIADLPFTDLGQRKGYLSHFADSSALVIVIRDVGCPVSKRYGQRLAKLEKQYAPAGVSFLFVNTGAHDSLESCSKEAALYGFQGRYARDLDGIFGTHLGVTSTTEVFVIDHNRRLRYRGAVDDQFGRGTTRDKAQHCFLIDALDAVLAKRIVSVTATTAPGCALEFGALPVALPPGEEVTWSGRVASIVEQKCQACHRPDGGAPFAFREAADVSGRRAMVRQVVLERVMPPWFASPDSYAFRNDTRLSVEERRDLLRWIQADCPTGTTQDAAASGSFTAGWVIGKPDLVVTAQKPFELPATGVVGYKNVEIELGLDQDRWVSAVQILPTHPEVVHHVIMFSFNPRTELWELFDSYLPGKSARINGEDSAFFLRKGSRLLLNIHYTPNGVACADQPSVGIRFAAAPPRNVMTGKIALLTESIAIPPHAADFRAVTDYVFEQEADLRSLMPHMHLRGKGSIIEIIHPDGKREVPLTVARFNPNWQLCYELAKPIHVLPGTRVMITSIYDNSADNPFNPDPNVTVRQGSMIDTEMGGAFLGWSLPLERFLKLEAASRSQKDEKSSAEFFGSLEGF